jgi:hypothetical protein
MQLPFLQRVHVLNTITTPSQSLLNELQTVEVWSFTLMLLALCAGLYCFLCFGLCLIFAVAVPVHPTCSFLDNRCTNMLSIFSWRERTSSLVHILLANPIPPYVVKCSYLYHVLWTQKNKIWFVLKRLAIFQYTSWYYLCLSKGMVCKHNFVYLHNSF